ncbi:HAD family hydrolase [Elongatibacter sediminis]|uniref:HAD family hydrolase n=1 Tax=Elongatibacter sediminis TaxID=3119006 RepID=A0AAW9RQA7_9GAMM
MTPDREQSGAERVWILDIDGTLMPTESLDNRCYWQAVHDCVGGAPGTLSLERFTHVTDSGILDEWMRQRYGRPPLPAEVSAVRERFLQLLDDTFAREPESFTATPGLFDWIDRKLGATPESIAIATGGWSHTALFKLRCAGLDRYALPLATSDDCVSRTGIMETARSRLAGTDADAGPTTYIGDGLWDLAASRELGWSFIGIARGSAADRLRAAGAESVLPDFHALTAQLETRLVGIDPVAHATS